MDRAGGVLLLNVWLLGAACASVQREPVGKARGEEASVKNLAASFAAGSPRFAVVSLLGGEARLLVASLATPTEPPRILASGADAPATDYGQRAVMEADGSHILYQCGGHEFCRADVATGVVEHRGGVRGSLYEFGPFPTDERYLVDVRQQGRGLQLYAGSLEGPGAPALAFEGRTISGMLVDVSPDGRRALVLEIQSPGHWELVEADLEAGTSRHLSARREPGAHVSAAAFAPGGRILAGVCGSSGGAALVALDADSGAELARYEELGHPGAQIEAIAVARRGDRVAVSLAAGSVSEVRVLDGATLRPLPAADALPPGVGGVLGFTPDGELVVTWSTVEAGRDLYRIDLRGGHTAPLLPTARSTPPAPPARGFPAAVPSFDGVQVPVNVYLPAGAAGSLPVAVNVQSGPGELAQLQRSSLVDLLLTEGFAVIEPNVRGAPGFGPAFEALDDGPRRADSFEDLAAVGRWAARQPWSDGGRPVLLGESYGGFLVLASLTRQPDLWRAGVDLYGISDWPSFFASTNRGTAESYAREVGRPETDGPLLESLSPLRDAARLRVPLLMVHGEDDGQVPLSQSVAFARAARAVKARVDTLFLEREGHGLSRPESWQRFRAALKALLDDTPLR